MRSTTANLQLKKEKQSKRIGPEIFIEDRELRNLLCMYATYYSNLASETLPTITKCVYPHACPLTAPHIGTSNDTRFECA